MIILLKNITAVLWELFLSFLDYMQFYGERKTRSTNIVRWSIAKLIIKVLKSNNKSNNCMYNYLIRAKKEKKGKKKPNLLVPEVLSVLCCVYHLMLLLHGKDETPSYISSTFYCVTAYRHSICKK